MKLPIPIPLKYFKEMFLNWILSLLKIKNRLKEVGENFSMFFRAKYFLDMLEIFDIKY